MSADWPLVPLGEILHKSNVMVDIAPDQTYKQVTVRLWGQGAVLRGETSGSAIGSPRQFEVASGQFIVSRIDARNGAFGLIPDSLEGAVVTNDFPVFTLDKKQIVPTYLRWLSKTATFVDLCKAASEGTTNRVRLKEQRFLQTTISLPPLSEQQRIVARIEELAAKIEEARRLRQTVKDETDMMSSRAIESVFNELHDAPQEKIGSLAKTTSGGTPDRSRSDFYGGKIPWLKSGELEDGFITKCDEFISDAAVAASSAKLFPAGTLLVAMYGATVGKTGIATFDTTTNQAVCALYPDERLLRDYLWWFLRGKRKSFIESSFGGAQPNISQKIIRETQIPVPTPAEQSKIVVELDALQQKANALKALQAQSAAELDALLPSVLDKAFKGEL